MRALITGAGGMVGSHLAERLFWDGVEVMGTYYNPTVGLAEIDGGIRLLECDIRYPQSVGRVIEEFRPDQIYHLAAQSLPAKSWERPYETMEINVNGTIAVFEAIRKVRSAICQDYDPVVIVACSSAEYGETLNQLSEGDVYVREDAPLLPLHPYGVSKVGQDLLSYQYYRNFKIRAIRARIFNSTGVRKVNDATSDFVRRAVESEKNGRYEVRVGNISTRRAIMDQRDLVTALILLAKKGRAGEAYNISSEHIYQMKDLLGIIENQMNHKLHIVEDPALLRPTDEKVIVGNIEKLKADVGWRQQIPMEQTVRDMLKYWREKLGEKDN